MPVWKPLTGLRNRGRSAILKCWESRLDWRLAGSRLSLLPSHLDTAFRKDLPVVMIRLARFGARKQPYYRVVVIEKDRAMRREAGFSS